ncbi:MAG: hypothetical protein GY861_16205 [bacterium]|nr:hypothetical protein [bacterium]
MQLEKTLGRVTLRPASIEVKLNGGEKSFDFGLGRFSPGSVGLKIMYLSFPHPQKAGRIELGVLCDQNEGEREGIHAYAVNFGNVSNGLDFGIINSSKRVNGKQFALLGCDASEGDFEQYAPITAIDGIKLRPFYSRHKEQVDK